MGACYGEMEDAMESFLEKLLLMRDALRTAMGALDAFKGTGKAIGGGLQIAFSSIPITSIFV